MTTFTVDEFINRWLTRYPSSRKYLKFRHVPLKEARSDRKYILEALTNTVFIHHNDPDEFRDLVVKLGYKRAALIFDKRPKDDKTRKANFGEILASEYLRQAENFDLPVYRLRWNTNPDTSMRGEDVLAFKFGKTDGTGREMCVAEAKVLKRYESRTVSDAYSQLSQGKRPRPNSIPFIYSVLRLQGENDKADKLLQFMNRTTSHPPRRLNFILLITGNNPQDPFAPLEKLPRVLDNLTVANLVINHLDKLIQVVFDKKVKP